MPRFLRSALAALLAGSAMTACAEAPAEHRPLLWKISDADNSLYLLGSFHMLQASDYPLAASTDAAFEDAERVLFELAPAELSEPALGQKMQAAGALPAGQSLRASLPAATAAQLEAWAAGRGVPIAAIDGFEPWYAGLVIGLIELQQMGLKPEHGLDRHFAQRAVAAGKPVAGLEVGDQQIALFDGLPAELQLQSLQDTLDDLGGMREDLERMHGLWRAGDAEGLYEHAGAELREKYPLLYQRINVDRNRAWLPRLQALLDESREDDALVVVGAIHLLGDNGLVKLLEAEGYAIERL